MLDHDGPVTDADLPDADVVVATWWETAFAVAALSPAKGRKFYFVQHHEVHLGLPAHISAGSYFLPMKKITIAQWLVDVMRERYGDDNVALIPNSVDLQQFDAPPRSRSDAPTVGFMYSGTHFKGLDTALQAVSAVRAAILELKIVSFGQGTIQKSFPLPEGSTYHQAPPQTEIARIYASCDVWVMASRSEGFGLPLLEAMACRCPVVSTRTGAAPELIVDGENGFVVDVEDAEALSGRIQQVLQTSQEEWRRMSDAAYAKARSYSWDDAADLLERALRAR